MKEPDFAGSRNRYLYDLYKKARELQSEGRFLSSVPAIAKARQVATFEEGKATEKS
jgi:hypothetical protein